MPTPINVIPGNENEGINFRLWLGILLPPFAAGINTLVGYMVSNYDCNVHNRHLVLMVNIVSAVLCLIGGLTTFSTRRSIEERSDDVSESLLHTQRFMLRVGLSFTAGFLLFICAGTLSTVILRACDL